MSSRPPGAGQHRPTSATRLGGARLIVHNASSMLMTSIVTSALGVVFWWLAARQFSATSVGLGAAAISASQLLASLSTFGFGTLLISELPNASAARRGSMVTTALLVCGTVGGTLGLTFAYLGPLFVPDLRPLAGDVAWIGFFAVAVSTMASGLVLDQIHTGYLRSELGLLRNSIFAALKLGALFVASRLLAIDSGLVIFATWPAANIIALALVFWLSVSTLNVLQVSNPGLAMLRRLGSAALSHHSLNLAVQMPALVLPVLVTALLSAESNAYFYTAWMIASVVGLPQTSLATTLFAVGVREPAMLVRRARLTLSLGTVAGLAAVVVIGIGGDLILQVFGRAYAEQGALTVRLLAIAVLPLMIKNHYIALLRVDRKIGMAALVLAAGAAIELAAAVVGARLGNIHGLCIGWLIGLTVEAAWMLPHVWKSARLGDVFSRERGAVQA